MLHKTRGIVINFVKYRETSIIAKVYTERFGIQSYIENGVRSSRGNNRIALFQPLTLLDLVVYYSDKKEIHRLKEIKCLHAYQTVPYDIRKSSMALFINELLNKTLHEHEENEPLFQFLLHSLISLDTLESNIENFHIYFLLRYAYYLGFGMENYQEVAAQLADAHHVAHLDVASVRVMEQLLHSPEFLAVATPLNRLQRNAVVDTLLQFYRLHIENLGELKSLGVLREVLQ